MIVIWPEFRNDVRTELLGSLAIWRSLVWEGDEEVDGPMYGRRAVMSWDDDEDRETSTAMGMTAENERETEAPCLDDDSTLARVFEPYRAFLTLVARRSIGPALAGKVGVSDIVQETFLAAQRCAGTFRGTTELQWRSWLKTILLNHLANQRRYHAAEKRRCRGNKEARNVPSEAGTVSTPSRQLMRQEREVALAEAMSRLPEHYRQVIGWHHHDRLTFVEIAERLGTSPDAGQKLWCRALVRLRELLGPEHDPR